MNNEQSERLLRMALAVTLPLKKLLSTDRSSSDDDDFKPSRLPLRKLYDCVVAGGALSQRARAQTHTHTHTHHKTQATEET